MKIQDLMDAGIAKAREAAKEGCSFVFTNGCYDVFTPAHARFLTWLRDGFIGDNRKRKLVVAVNSDDSIRALKGPSRPFHSLEDRCFVLEKYADIVIPFLAPTPIMLIEALKPDVLAKGGDYNGREIVGGPFVRDNGGIVVYGPLTDGVSTTRCLDAIDGKLDLLRTAHGLLIGAVGVPSSPGCTKCGVLDSQVDALDLADAILNDRNNCPAPTETGLAVLKKHFQSDHRIWRYYDETVCTS